MAGGEQDAQRLAAMEKRAKVVELRRQGLTFAAIGQEMGFSYQRAQTLYRQALAAVVSPAVEALRAEHLEELAEARERVLGVMRTDHVVVQQGHVVSKVIGTDDEGKPIYGDPLIDDGPVLDAARTLATLQARESRLVGADAPQKVEASVEHTVDPASIELRGLIEQQREANDAERARLAGES